MKFYEACATIDGTSLKMRKENWKVTAWVQKAGIHLMDSAGNIYSNIDPFDEGWIVMGKDERLNNIRLVPSSIGSRVFIGATEIRGLCSIQTEEYPDALPQTTLTICGYPHIQY